MAGRSRPGTTTPFTFAAFRTQLFNPGDMPNVEKVQAGYKAQPLSAFDVAGVLPWTRHEHAMKDLDVFNAALATLETRAHVELLVARGDLTRNTVDGVVLYSS